MSGYTRKWSLTNSQPCSTNIQQRLCSSSSVCFLFLLCIFFPRIRMNKALCNTSMYLTTDSCSDRDIAGACYLWWCSQILQASVLAFNSDQCGSPLALMLSFWLKKVTCHANSVSPHWNILLECYWNGKHPWYCHWSSPKLSPCIYTWGHTPTQPKKIYATNFFFLRKLQNYGARKCEESGVAASGSCWTTTKRLFYHVIFLDILNNTFRASTNLV